MFFVLRPSINAIAHAQSQRFDDSTNSDFPYCNDATETCICFLWQHALKQKLEYHNMPPPPCLLDYNKCSGYAWIPFGIYKSPVSPVLCMRRLRNENEKMSTKTK